MRRFLRERILDKTTLDEKFINGAKRVKKEIRRHIITAILAAFGFMIALFWRDAIQSTINELLNRFGIIQNAFYYKILVAIIVTIICVFAIIILANFEEKEVKP